MGYNTIDPNEVDLLSRIQTAREQGNQVAVISLKACLDWYRTGYQYGMDCAYMMQEKEQDRNNF